MKTDFRPLFAPKTMAVVGISLTNHSHPANVIYNKLNLRYPVTVYPVNPKGGRLLRDRIYKNMAELPAKIDHVVIAARAEHVPGIMKECINCGARGATVISGGFAERGNHDLQQRITNMAAEAKFPFIGPNCLGIYVPDRFDTFFLPGERLVRPLAGNVALVSQSGGVLVDQMVKFAGQGIGLSIGVSIGNKALVGETDLLSYLAADSQTKVIAFYIEGFGPGQGRQFVELARKCSKPVVVLKAGKSSQGKRAVSSHTASLAGDYAVLSQVLAQHGIVEARNEYEMVSFCESLSCYTQAAVGNVGIITVSGGHGVLAVDACASQGLKVPPIDDATQGLIRRNLGPSIRSIASLKNPIDLTGSARDDDFIAAANGLANAPGIDTILVLLLPYSPGISSDLGARLSHVKRDQKMPLVAYVPHVEKYRMLIEGFELNRVPVSNSIEGAVLMIAALKRCQPC